MLIHFHAMISDRNALSIIQTIDEETLVAPKIIKKLPKVVQMKEGESTTLEVQATGKPQPTPKWLMANEEIIPSDDFLIENYTDGTSVLTITNVQPDTIDKITFEAVSPVGVAKTTTKIQVEGIKPCIFKVMYTVEILIQRHSASIDELNEPFFFQL